VELNDAVHYTLKNAPLVIPNVKRYNVFQGN